MKIPTALALFPMALCAVEVELDFSINSVTSTATAVYSIGPQSSNMTSQTWDNLHYSGNMLATVEVDPSTGEFDSFEFTGGCIETPDLNAVMSVLVGSVNYVVTFTSNGIKRYPDSVEEDPLNGGIPGPYHYTDFEDGSFTLTNYPTIVPARFVEVNREVADDPTYLIGPNIIFPYDLESVPTLSDPLSQTFLASLDSNITLAPLPLAFNTIPVWVPTPTGGGGYVWSLQSFQQQYAEVGKIYATATFTIPTDYGQWATDNGLTLTTGEEVNAAGIPYALLFAFDLPADAASLPLTCASAPEPTVELTLPSGGLGFTVEVEYAADPAGPFTPLPDENFLDGTDSLDAGQDDPATLSYPAGLQGYMRFFVTL